MTSGDWRVSCPSDSTRWTSARFCLSRPLIEFLYVPLHGRYAAIHTARLGGVSWMTPPRGIEIGPLASGLPSLSLSQVDLGAQEHSEHEAKKAAVRAGQISSSTSQLQR